MSAEAVGSSVSHRLLWFSVTQMNYTNYRFDDIAFGYYLGVVGRDDGIVEVPPELSSGAYTGPR